MALLVVQSATGLLFRVDPLTGVATRVDLGETLLTNGDGLLVVGTTLYVVQNRLNQVAVIKLSPDGTSGVLVDTLTSPASGENTGFDVPTTVAQFGNSLVSTQRALHDPAAPDDRVLGHSHRPPLSYTVAV